MRVFPEQKASAFEAAHWLPTFPDGHKCRRMHGHSFKVTIVVEGEVRPEDGYLLDFGEIKKLTTPNRGNPRSPLPQRNQRP